MGEDKKDAIKREIAKNLLYYRKKKQMTQRQLAEHLGMRHNSISAWETGINSIDVETLIRICRVLDVSLEEAYGPYMEGGSGYSEKEKRLVERYRERPDLQAAVDILLGLSREEEPEG